VVFGVFELPLPLAACRETPDARKKEKGLSKKELGGGGSGLEIEEQRGAAPPRVLLGSSQLM
jgi:hypothetical protein